MRLVKVIDSVNTFGYHCASCHVFRDSKDGDVYADLDGIAFHVFYCKGCADALTVPNVRESPQPNSI